MSVLAVKLNNPRILNLIPSRFPLEQDPQEIDFQGVKVTADFKILRTMIDGKIRGIISGRGKAHCFNCLWKLEDYYPKTGAGDLFRVG